MASEKENVSNGTEGREQESHHGAEDADSHQRAECPADTPKRAVVGEAAQPLSSKENVSGRPVPWGDECYSTPAGVKAEEKSYCGLSEKQRRISVDFATVTTADLGITPEGFVNGSTAKSPAALKLRRRSAIGARGSPENNTLIQYVAQQKSNRQKEAFTQASPCRFARSLKSKMDIFQRTFKSVQEAEGKTGFSGPSRVSAAFQAAGCLAQNKVPVTKEHSLDQKSEAFVSDCNGADLKENLKQNLTNGSKSGRRICSILSLQQDGTEPAAVSKERTYKQGNPVEYSGAVLIRDILETSHDFSPDHISKEVRGDVISDQGRKKVNFAEELIVGIYDESKPPATPLQTRNASLREPTQSGSQLRSVLRKTPVKQLMDCMKEYSNNTAHRGGSESFTVSDHICEALQTEKTEQNSPKRVKKKKVTFGEDLSPEIFDEALPANTPLRRGSTPVCCSGSERGSSFTRAGLIEEPLTQPDFDCSDECTEPPQELQEGSVVSEKLLPVENTKGAETDKLSMRTTRSSNKRKYSTISEGTDCSISRTTSTKNAKDIKNPSKNEPQRPKSVTVFAAKKKQKTKRATFGKRRKRKVKKSLYGEREMASKKPLLSPILEIPEVFSSASSPNSPKAIAHFPDHSTPRDVHNDVQQEQVTERMRETNIPVVHEYPSSGDLDIVEEGSPSNTVFQFPNVVPNTNDILNTFDCFQQAEETACLKEKTENDLLIEHEKLQGDFPKKEEWLTGLEFLNLKDTDVHEILQRTPPKRSSRSRPPRRSSSTVYIPPIEKSHFEMTGDDLQVSSFDVEEVLSAPQPKNNSLKKPLRRKSSMSSETSRVRRSMRLQKGAEIEGLAWIEVTNEILQSPSLLAPACRTRRRTSTSVLTESENIHHREENLIQFAASGKENSESVHVAGGPCRRRRKSICVSTPQETRTCSQTRKRSITNSVYRRDSSNQEYSEEMNILFPNNMTT